MTWQAGVTAGLSGHDDGLLSIGIHPDDHLNPSGKPPRYRLNQHDYRGILSG